LGHSTGAFLFVSCCPPERQKHPFFKIAHPVINRLPAPALSH
jgi:hypothetical protein